MEHFWSNAVLFSKTLPILSTSKIKGLSIAALLLKGVLLCAQSVSQFGTLPVVNFNMGLARGWEVNLKWETRQLMATLVDGECINCSPEFTLSDQSLIVAKKVGLSSKLAAGYLLRIRGTEIFQRSIQQFSVVQRLSSMRLAHRFAADQTFGGGDPTEWRLRYRLGTELPLNGQEADPKELYLKINNEYLGSWQGSDSDLEIRLVPVLGYLFTDKNKLEFGLDYRIDSFLANEARQRFWGVLAWYYKW